MTTISEEATITTNDLIESLGLPKNLLTNYENLTFNEKNEILDKLVDKLNNEDEIELIDVEMEVDLEYYVDIDDFGDTELKEELENRDYLVFGDESEMIEHLEDEGYKFVDSNETTWSNEDLFNTFNQLKEKYNYFKLNEILSKYL
jgi:hypothetical protein